MTTTKTALNPLMAPSWLPHFKAIQPAHLEPAVREILAENSADLETLLNKTKEYTWQSLIQPLDDLSERLFTSLVTCLAFKLSHASGSSARCLQCLPAPDHGIPYFANAAPSALCCDGNLIQK